MKHEKIGRNNWKNEKDTKRNEKKRKETVYFRLFLGKEEYQQLTN